MIVRRTTDRNLIDREALAQWSGHSVATIRLHCTAVACTRDRRLLYDAEVCLEQLSSIATRRRSAA